MPLSCQNKDEGKCSVRKQVKYELMWTSGQDLQENAEISIHAGRFKPFLTWKFLNLEFCGADTLFKWKAFPTPDQVWKNAEMTLIRARLSASVKAGDSFKILITAIPSMWRGVNLDLSARVNGVMEDCPELTLTANPNVVERVSLYSTPAEKHGKIRTVAVAEDRYGNPAFFKHPVAARISFNGKTEDFVLEEYKTFYHDPPESTAYASVTVNAGELSIHEAIGNAVRDGCDYVITGNPVGVGFYGKSAVFGEFHWHTEMSGDGYRSIDDAFFSAKNHLNMDFASASDHSTSGGNWEKTVEISDKYNDEEFITFFGWENSTDRGHDNYYFTDPDHPLRCGGSADFTGGYPAQLGERLSQYKDFIAIPHHTNTTAEARHPDTDEPYWREYPIAEPYDFYRLIEIFQQRGNQEADEYEDVFKGWHQNNHSSVIDFLNRGYKIGFAGGTDNHQGWPSRAFSEEERVLGADHAQKSVILTGVWTDRHDRQSLFDALYNRHTWAVWDTRAIAYFDINGSIMGSDITAKKGEKLTLNIKIDAEDFFRSIEVVSKDGVIWSGTRNSLSFEKSIDAVFEESGYYYVRAVLRNGGIIYISPVFVDLRKE